MTNKVMGIGMIIYGITVMTISSIEIGKALHCRKICYEAEKLGGGLVTYRDIHGKDHTVRVEAI